MWTVVYPREGTFADESKPLEDGVVIYAQGVPAHIGDTGPIWDWLPPPVEDRDGNLRAVFICSPWTRKGTDRNGQEYRNYLLMLTGEEYERITWHELWVRIGEALEQQAEEILRTVFAG
jgi:hypothetical protein